MIQELGKLSKLNIRKQASPSSEFERTEARKAKANAKEGFILKNRLKRIFMQQSLSPFPCD